MSLNKSILQLFLVLSSTLSLSALASDLQPSAVGIKPEPAIIRTTPVKPISNQPAKSKKELISEKQVSHWTEKRLLKVKPNQSVHLTPRECNTLGGKISYLNLCESDVLCTVGSHVLCIDRMQE
jgi:hypothetical protein